MTTQSATRQKSTSVINQQLGNIFQDLSNLVDIIYELRSRMGVEKSPIPVSPAPKNTDPNIPEAQSQFLPDVLNKVNLINSRLAELRIIVGDIAKEF